MGNLKVFRRSNVKVESRKRRIKILFRSFLSLVLSAGLAGAFYYASLHLEGLRLKTLLVEGTGGPISTDAMIADSEIHLGTPIFAIRLKQVVERLKANPWIDHIKVTRKLPHTLVIKITQHEPKFILSMGKLYYVGARGEIFKELNSRQDVRDLPYFSGLTRDEIEKDPPRAREILLDALKLLKDYEQGEKTRELGISEINYDKASGFNIFPEKEKVKIMLGFDDFEAKVKRLGLAVDKMRSLNRSFAAIDLNYEGKVILAM